MTTGSRSRERGGRRAIQHSFSGNPLYQPWRTEMRRIPPEYRSNPARRSREGRRKRSGLFDFRTGLLHHPAPLLDLDAKMPAEALGRAADRLDALIGEFLLHVRHREDLVEF